MSTTSAAAERPQKQDAVDHFIDRLENLSAEGDRAALAKLRRSLIDYGHDFSAYTVLGYALPRGAPQQRLDRYLLVAGLYATHPETSGDDHSLGQSLRMLHARLNGVGEGSLDNLVEALLNADDEDMPIRLRHVITRLAAEDIPVNYRRLLRDLLHWDSAARYVQRRWARDYWVGQAQSDESGNDQNIVDTAGTVTDDDAA